MDPIEVLTLSFLALADEQIRNLEYHSDRGTTICCGEKSVLYTDGKGGG